MALPEDYEKCRVTGRWVNGATGLPSRGTVHFEPRAPRVVTDSGYIVLPQPETFRLSGGELDEEIVSTDDPNINVVGWTWEVTEDIDGVVVSYDVPAPAGGVINLKDFGSLDPSTGNPTVVGPPGPPGEPGEPGVVDVVSGKGATLDNHTLDLTPIEEAIPASAAELPYDGSASGIGSENTQDAIDETVGRLGGLPEVSAGRGLAIVEVSPTERRVELDNYRVDIFAPGATSLTVPVWARLAHVTVIGGGGGGGGGRRGAAGTVRGGGGGGQGGAVVSGWVLPSNLGPTIQVGAGGAAGARGAADNADGGNGGAGGNTTVYKGIGSPLLDAVGGKGGAGGTSTGGGTGGGLAPLVPPSIFVPPAPTDGAPGLMGGGEAAAQALFLNVLYALDTVGGPYGTAAVTMEFLVRMVARGGSGGGGGGGGISTGNVLNAASPGINGQSHTGGGAGTNASKNGGPAAPGLTTGTDLFLAGGGGGGGYPSASGAAGNGGAGAGYGGGGGGGAASLNGNAAGAGGAGSGGALRIVWVA